jgi:alcohol dehydrogenase
MQRFDFQMRTRFVVGEGVLSQLGAIAQELGGTRVLVVSDPGIVQAGLFERGVHSLRAGGMQIASFHEFQENPDSNQVELGAKVAREFQPDLLVGLGGGSSMDCAKGINFVHSCGGGIHDYWGVGKASKPMLPLIAVPTTAGTGSESQSYALISDAVTHAKMACGDPKAAARVALLDPLLTRHGAHRNRCTDPRDRIVRVPQAQPYLAALCQRSMAASALRIPSGSLRPPKHRW